MWTFDLVLTNRYVGSFCFCALLCLVLQLLSRENPKSPPASSSSSNLSTSRSLSTSKKAVGDVTYFGKFQFNYLVVFSLAMFSDWLQGPYVYELYVSYGFTQQQIAELFVCGFGSSMVVGTFVGGLADKYGRKLMCILYSVMYILACFTKLVPEYWTLMLGRFLSGICTSLLFSVFEAWMVCEHNKLGFDEASLGNTFSYATFGNGLAAVIAGLIANTAAESSGYVAPFIVAMIPLAVTALIVIFTWTENYGNANHNMTGSFTKAFELIKSDARICTLAIAQSCFEGAMYTFVFMWTPALKTAEESKAEEEGRTLQEGTSQYLGVIFACFMVCVMVGSSVFKLFNTNKTRLYNIPLILHAVSFTTMLLITIFYEYKVMVYICFLIFEISVGVFYPAYGVIKSEKLPEEIRSSVMNIFRIPLNAFVVLLLLKIKFLSPPIVFGVCTFTHGVSWACYYYFYLKMQKSAEGLGPNDQEMQMALMSQKNNENV